MKKIRKPVIKIGCVTYLLPSIEFGASLIVKLSKLVELDHDLSSSDSKNWGWRPSETQRDLELSTEEILVDPPAPPAPKSVKKLQNKIKALPDYSSLMVECDCGNERISGHVCGHCGAGRKGGVK